MCGVGVAYGAQVSGLRILDGTVTDLLEGRSFIYKAHINWVYSCSWGPEDNGISVEGPGYVAKVSYDNRIICNKDKNFLFAASLNFRVSFVHFSM